MKRVLVWIVLAFAGAGLFAQTAPAATYATGSLTEMVYELPSDQGKLYLTVVGVKTDAKYQQLTKLFNEKYQPVRDDFHYNQLDRRSTMYQARYTEDYKAFPAVRVQLADGTPVKEYAGKSIPAEAQLVAELKAECFRRRQAPRRVQPAPQPDNSPVQPVGDPPVNSNVRPLYRFGLSWHIVVLALLTGAGLSLYDERKRSKE